MALKASSLSGLCCGLVLAAAFAQEARATLIYQEIGGTDLIYDSVTDQVWTRDADISGQLLTFQQANVWADGLSLAGVPGWGWELPTPADFTSLYTQLFPYGAPGSPGASDKYGAAVAFGAGPDDSALNVQGLYWTNTDSTDFNFFYGYSGYSPDSGAYAAWAVAAPEPATVGLVLSGLAACGGVRRGRRNRFLRRAQGAGCR
jgi:hypothetical protein